MAKVGIYRIVCRADNKRYIGSSNDVYRRIGRHFNDLRNGKHQNSHLQRAYDKYGKDQFVADVLFLCEEDSRHELEQMAIDAIRPEFNSMTLVKGVLSHSSETRAKMSAAHKGKPKSKEMRARLSASKTGVHHSMESATAAAAIANRGRPAWNKGLPKRLWGGQSHGS